MKTIFFLRKLKFAMLSLILFSCNTQQEKGQKELIRELQTLQKEDWKKEGYIDSLQILLTNHYEIGESYSYGASSFIIKSKNNIPLICTAKHLLGDAMGISPEVSTVEFNKELKFWNVFPRNNRLSSDTISVSKLVNEELNIDDIILLEFVKSEDITLQSLKPRFSKVERGERLEIIGCEYADSDCSQKEYTALMTSYDTDDSNGMMCLKVIEEFDLSGFSGAPVIDENGYVVGVVYGGGTYGSSMYIWAEPISKVEKWLN